MIWNRIACKSVNLQLVGTLNGGQSFRWKHNQETNEWTGIFSSTVWKLKQDEEGISYQILGTLYNPTKDIGQSAIADSKILKNTKRQKKSNETCKENMQSDQKVIEYDCNFFENLLKSYFRLDVELAPLYESWSKSDPLFGDAAKKFYGIRMLNQEPVENLFSFICSQNNHISRISTMIEKLCTNYGENICDIDGNSYYSFPNVEKLADKEVDGNLRVLGFGYRSKFIQQSASQICEWGGEKWIDSLKIMPYKEAKCELIKLMGIGAKVADCICLMSLNHLEAVPVDTHVYQIASQNYLFHLKGLKSVTDRVYNEIGDYFRDLYGPLAGWAHTILFCADLKKFEKPGSKRISNGERVSQVSSKKKQKTMTK